MAWIKTGTINVANNSDIVTGNGTSFNSSIMRGDFLVINSLNYEIDGVVNSTQLKLAEPYTGTTANAVKYGIARTGISVADLNDSANTLIDLVSDLIENGSSGGSGGSGISSAAVDANGHLIITQTDGTTIDAGLVKGADGADGQDGAGGGEVAIQSVVDLTQFAGQAAGNKGIKLIVPVSEGAPTVSLTQQSSVVIPQGSTNAGIGIWAYLNSSTGTLGLTLGLTEVPVPQPGGSDEDIDLSGSSTFYAPFNAITPLGITIIGSPTSLTLSRAFTQSQLKIMRKVDTDIVTQRNATWLTGATGSPYPVSGTALPSTMVLNAAGDGTRTYANGRITLNKGAYLQSPALGLEFKSSSDPATTQTPPSVRLHYKGSAPSGTLKGIMIGRLQDWGGGAATHSIHWNEKSIEFYYARSGGGSESVLSDEVATLTGRDITVETEWVNDENGPGGTVTFYVDGVQYGAAKPTEWKPRITAASDFQVNASVGNTSDSSDGVVVESVGLTIGFPDVSTTYNTISDGAVTADDLQNLVVDATGVTSQQPERVLSYIANGNQEYDLTIVVGNMVLPAGRPYAARLEDWSSGSAVTVGTLTMTRPAAQNCRFEDDLLFGAQGSWTEVMPQETVPVLDGIAYGCEGIRQGNYTMFQFVYWLDNASAPFGDPTGLQTYMRPHKWIIVDNEGNELRRIEKPNGEPLNATSTKPVWEGQYDGRSIPQITSGNRWYPHGTARSSVVYRNGKPPAYSQEFIWNNLPVYDQRVPFASHTGFSVNGFDLRIYAGSAGGDGQSNGFANWKLMPIGWGQYDYESIKTYAATSLDPYKNLYTDISATPVAALWLEYTPFNTMGRCPVVGPGGTRDDRQIIAEPVAQYMRDVSKVRPHDHTPLADIALDYLTGYASDPYNAVNGATRKLTPLYRNNARRNITMRNHYYGPGEATTPAAQAWYAQVGRLSEWTTNRNPLRCNIPGSGKTADRPYFGGFEIDNLHAHQFPHWGSMLFQTPEFAMFGVNFSDQSRLYGNSILDSVWGPESFSQRECAWPFMHAALQWKTASSNSTRLYSRAEILDWVLFDFENFYDRWYASTPGYLNPPTNILNTDGSINDQAAIMAGAAKFGPCYMGEGGLELSEFQAGYWLSALHAAHKIGFLDALSEASPKAAAIVNWLKSVHRKRIVNRMNEGTLLNNAGSDYQVRYWTRAQMQANGSNTANLPQTLAATIQADPLKAPSWDKFTDGTTTYSRDGQANDANLAGAALLLDMGMTGADLEQAAAKAEQLFQEKLASETARGYSLAGSEWFKYHQTTNNRPYKP